MAIDKMICPTSDTLSDLAFTAVNGNATMADAAKIHEHLKTCDDCAVAYTLWRDVANTGRAARSATLATDSCPEDNMVAEYLDGVISPVHRNTFEQHCATCATCARQLSDLHTLLTASTRPAPLYQIAMEWLRDGLGAIEEAAGTFQSVPLASAPVLKSNDAPTALSWEATHDQHVIKVTVQRNSPEQLTLYAALLFEGSAAPGLRVTVRSGGEILESRVTDDGGAVVQYGLPVSDYAIEIDLPGGPFAFSIEITASE
jgi:hypothetical protein